MLCSCAAQPPAVAWAGSPRRVDHGGVLPLQHMHCWDSSGHMQRPHVPHGFEVLQLQSSTSASAEIFLRSSFCSRFRGRDVGMGTAPAQRDGWLDAQGAWGRTWVPTAMPMVGSGQAELRMKGSAGWLTHVKPTRPWDKPASQVWGCEELSVLSVPPSTSPWAMAPHWRCSWPPGQQRGEATAPHEVHIAAKLSPVLVVSGLTSMVRNPSFHKEV